MTTDELTEADLLKSIEAKADQLNAVDLVATGPMDATIKSVRKGNAKQPVFITLEGVERPYKPCKTCRRVLAKAWTAKPNNWVGKRLRLYTDPDVVYAGERVGGIRISHVSHIDEPLALSLPITRGKNAEVIIYPLEATLSDEDTQYIEQVKADIAEADTTETLNAIGFVLKQKPKPVQDALRGVYAARLEELKGATK